MDHVARSTELLAGYDRERIQPGDVTEESRLLREHFLARLLAEAQVHATLAVAAELEAGRIAGWGQEA